MIRYGTDGNYRVRPPGGLVAARFRHYEARSGRPLLHDHVLLSVKGQRLDGKWGSIHTTALHENTVAASALYNELVAAEVCEELGLATEPRTVTPGRRPVMEIAGVPHGLIRWTAQRSDQIASCLSELEHEYVTAVDVTATVFVMNDGGRFHRRHLLAEARRHLALVLRGHRRDPGLDDRVVATAITTHCLDISEPTTVRGLEAGYRLYTARWALSDLPARRRPPAAPDPERRSPTDSGEPPAPRPPGQDAGEWEIPRIPLQYDRAVLAGAVVREQLRTTTVVRGRAYDVVAHQQAAMAEQLLAHEPTDPEHDDHDDKPGRHEALDLTALRALRDSRTDVEALDLTAERLRHLQDAFTAAADRAHTTMDRYTRRDDAEPPHPAHGDDQQAHRPQEPGPHRGREAGH